MSADSHRRDEFPFALVAPPGSPNHQQFNRLQHTIPEDEEGSQMESQRMEIPPSNDQDYDEEDSSDDEAPNDLMIEMNPLIAADRLRNSSPLRPTPSRPTPPGGVSPPNMGLRDRHGETNLLRRLFGARLSAQAAADDDAQEASTGTADAEEKRKALLVWTEMENLDEFLRTVFDYYSKKGFFCIILGRLSNLLILAFIVGFSTFLISCVDYSQLTPQVPKKTLKDVIYSQCITHTNGLLGTFIIFFSMWWLWNFFMLVLDFPKLRQMKLFYEGLLGIKESDMDTVTWREITQKIELIKRMPNSNPHGRPGLDKLDAHTIANRIMRKENYLIAMFNKDILDLTIPYLGKRQMLTKIIEWNLSYCIIDYVFDSNGLVRKRFLKNTHRLQKRFATMALVNLLLAPILFVLMILHFFFRYAEEYQKNPSSLGTRQYSLFAWWKFREFNELPHLYQERLSRSYKKALRYLEQFPKEKIIIAARFLAFIAGSFTAVLAILALVDNQFLEFEIIKDRSVLFFIGIFGGLSAISRSMIPDENQVFEPEKAMREVIEDTHYLPESWRRGLNTEDVKRDFAGLFDLKIVLFLQEVLSVITTPFLMYYQLQQCSPAIVDFFREFTVHVDSLGNVCSFAVFDFRTNGDPRYGAPTENRRPHLQSKEGKMEQSFLYFKANNPDWEPDHLGSQYLHTVSRVQRTRPDGTMSVDVGQMMLQPAARRIVNFGEGATTDFTMASSGADFEDQPLEPLGLFGLLDLVFEGNRYRFSR